MPVLHRWDENDDVVPKRAVWRRYDETESGSDSKGDASENEHPVWTGWNINFFVADWISNSKESMRILVSLPRSSYSFDGDDDDESDPSFEEGGNKDMTFTLHRLESLHGLNDDEKKSSYSTNGMSRKRIRHVVKNPGCPCACSVPVAVLYRICCAFWSLGKCAQDALLWTLQTEGGRRRINYMIEGLL